VIISEVIISRTERFAGK